MNKLRNLFSWLKSNPFDKLKAGIKNLDNRPKLGVSIISKLMIIVLLMVIAPINVLNVEAIPNMVEISQPDEFTNTLRLDVQSSIPIQFDGIKVPEIVSGESEYQRKQREETEKKASEEAAKSSRNVITREVNPSRSVSYSADPGLAEKRALVKRAASTYGIDWKILEAVWQVESGKSWNTKVKSYAGAQGPMQFMPGTWRAYKQDGNGDGTADVYNAEDALYGAANYLAANGAASNIDRALFAYNHAQWYVNKVKAVANSI